MAFFTATGDNFVLGRVNEGVHTFLMQVEGLALLVFEIVDLVDVDAAVKGATHHILNIGIVLNFCDPTLVALLGDDLHIGAVHHVLVRADWLGFFYEVVLGFF